MGTGDGSSGQGGPGVATDGGSQRRLVRVQHGRQALRIQREDGRGVDETHRL
ncbi:hypothetical protein PBI_WILLIS_237 [Mycobacterium phage Willis]|uniref:Uncharacterized protein n=1 Tax=Mycobacterium phage Willis TaxID=1486404 RepID=A0A068CDX7_9CAUD|nr:hypothetical protein PBI_WILLIS_237 [Mycobacterium phage Willis]